MLYLKFVTDFLTFLESIVVKNFEINFLGIFWKILHILRFNKRRSLLFRKMKIEFARRINKPNNLELKEFPAYGLFPQLRSWILSYLSDRRIAVAGNCNNSDFQILKAGVSQGSGIYPYIIPFVYKFFSSPLPPPFTVILMSVPFMLSSIYKTTTHN